MASAPPAPADKTALLLAWKALLEDRLAALSRSSSAARAGTRVDGDHRPANRGERAAVSSQGYLAHGLAQRAAVLRSTVELLEQVSLEPADQVRTGALVQVEGEDGEEQLLFIVPGAQGDEVLGVRLVSPQAPVARALAGREEGDAAVVAGGGGARELAVVGVW
jgi:transcription elongation factor GreA